MLIPNGIKDPSVDRSNKEHDFDRIAAEVSQLCLSDINADSELTVDKRVAAIQADFDKRVAVMQADFDKRVESIQADFDKRSDYESTKRVDSMMSKRIEAIEAMQADFNKRAAVMQAELDKCMHIINDMRRIEAIEEHIDALNNAYLRTMEMLKALTDKIGLLVDKIDRSEEKHETESKQTTVSATVSDKQQLRDRFVWYVYGLIMTVIFMVIKHYIFDNFINKKPSEISVDGSSKDPTKHVSVITDEFSSGLGVVFVVTIVLGFLVFFIRYIG